MTAGVVQLQLLTRSDRLRQRRLEDLPVRDGVFTGDQGRGWGPVQPILCEENRRPVPSCHRTPALGSLPLGSGQRDRHLQLRRHPCGGLPGPLSEEERRAFQLIENLGRVDLQPGELAAALLYERCAFVNPVLALSMQTVHGGSKAAQLMTATR